MQWNSMYHKCNTVAKTQGIDLQRLEQDAPSFPVKLTPNQLRAMVEQAFRSGYQQGVNEARGLS